MDSGNTPLRPSFRISMMMYSKVNLPEVCVGVEDASCMVLLHRGSEYLDSACQ